MNEVHRSWLDDPTTEGVAEDRPTTERAPGSPDHPGGDDGALEERIIAALREIYDPEIPVNIYDLGLIYGIRIGENRVVDLEMTLTTPGCPVAQTFPGTVEAAVREVDGVEDARVDLVWDPPWTMDNMTDEVKLQLGLL
jgi:FeS assembly SUF system protein